MNVIIHLHQLISIYKSLPPVATSCIITKIYRRHQNTREYDHWRNQSGWRSTKRHTVQKGRCDMFANHSS